MWEVKKPVYGDQIRVNRGLYAHHGIYASDDCVIHFAANGIKSFLLFLKRFSSTTIIV